jgi:hypothetical protein
VSTAIYTAGLLIAGAINPDILVERIWLLAALFALFLAMDLLIPWRSPRRRVSVRRRPREPRIGRAAATLRLPLQ